MIVSVLSQWKSILLSALASPLSKVWPTMSSPDFLPFFPWLMETKLFPRIPNQAPNQSLNWQHKAQPLGVGIFPKGILFVSTRQKTLQRQENKHIPIHTPQMPHLGSFGTLTMEKFLHDCERIWNGLEVVLILIFGMPSLLLSYSEFSLNERSAWTLPWNNNSKLLFRFPTFKWMGAPIHGSP